MGNVNTSLPVLVMMPFTKRFFPVSEVRGFPFSSVTVAPSFSVMIPLGGEGGVLMTSVVVALHGSVFNIPKGLLKISLPFRDLVS